MNQLQFEQQHNELVSVILTTHKWNKFLPTALNSILNQTHTNFELIVVDDYSPIEDVKLYDQIMNDPRIKRVRMKNNSGTYECRNIGIKASKGKFVTFADSDDWMHPQKLEALSNKTISSVHTGNNFIVAISVAKPPQKAPEPVEPSRKEAPKGRPGPRPVTINLQANKQHRRMVGDMKQFTGYRGPVSPLRVKH